MTDRHGIGVGPLPAVVLMVGFAAYAALVAVVAHGAESVWGEWAAASYGAAALVAAWSWRRHPGATLLVALVGAFAVPAARLPPGWGATSEVRVVERAAALWLAHGSPYVSSGHLLSWRSYDPYLPGMSLFGVPHALGLPGALGDPVLWLTAATVTLLAVACRVAAPGGAGRCAGCRRQALLRALLLVACPVFSLPMALGVTDPPVIALMCLGLAWAARRPSAQSGAVSTSPPPPGAGRRFRGSTPHPRGHPLLAGVAIGIGCALKATAWPALPVVLALIAVRGGRSAAARFAGGALGAFAVLVALMAPALLGQPAALWQNIVAYPLGLSRRRTPAASPLPGHLLAEVGTLGHLAAIVLLGLAALAMGLSLALRPPSGVRQATVRLAVGLTVMFLLAPDARFGYFAYPLGILAWLLATGVPARRAWRRQAMQGRVRPSCYVRGMSDAKVRA